MVHRSPLKDPEQHSLAAKYRPGNRNVDEHLRPVQQHGSLLVPHSTTGERPDRGDVDASPLKMCWITRRLLPRFAPRNTTSRSRSRPSSPPASFGSRPSGTNAAAMPCSSRNSTEPSHDGATTSSHPFPRCFDDKTRVRRGVGGPAVAEQPLGVLPPGQPLSWERRSTRQWQRLRVPDHGARPSPHRELGEQPAVAGCQPTLPRSTSEVRVDQRAIAIGNAGRLVAQRPRGVQHSRRASGPP